jgi:hypothetical protein
VGAEELSALLVREGLEITAVGQVNYEHCLKDL